MEIRFDASELIGFADAMGQAPDDLRNEMQLGSQVLLHEGIGYAQEEAPRGDSGNLAGSIRVLDGPSAEGGAYGSDLVYASQREEGGTIYPRNGDFLWFEIDGQLIRARKVEQEGSHYMQKSMERLEPRVEPVYQLSVDRVLGRV